MPRCCGRGVAAPKPTYSQVEQRARRLKWLRFEYDGEFSLSEEIHEILGPLAVEVAALPSPLVLRDDVAAAHSAACDLLAWTAVLVGVRPPRRCGRSPHLEPEVSDTAVTSGAWAADLVTAAEPFTAALGVALGRDPVPSWTQGETISDQLVGQLRPLDTAAKDLRARTARAQEIQARPTFAEHQRQRNAARQAERAAKRLQRLGMTP